ncbi:pathoproteinsis-related family protein [Hibiscus syriacus]|uniref:Pathoproteinsis-related family protein n=2 Tax=Hibiscus syriacus TaxID=106335 RepID=A0A6A2YC82_HIBSY|nr:pathoproteinsis-related family protein [Hibiscus syriacus]
MEVSIARIRSRTLWKQGANLSSFRIPSRTVPVPHVRRLAIVYENLGNRSSQYYSISGYSLITPVIGFMVFDASNARAARLRSMGLDTKGKPISIHFSNVKYSVSARCATFSSNGTVDFSRMMVPNVCYTSNQGHFSVAVPLKRKQRPLYPWVIGIVLGFCALVLAGYFGFVSMKLLKTKRIQAMERQADEGEILNNRWVSCSKMPSAAVTRTQPVLENGGFP